MKDKTLQWRYQTSVLILRFKVDNNHFSFVRAIGRNLGLSLETQCVKKNAFCRQCIFMTIFFWSTHWCNVRHNYAPPSSWEKGGGAYYFATVGLSVGRSVCRQSDVRSISVDVDRCSLFSFWSHVKSKVNCWYSSVVLSIQYLMTLCMLVHQSCYTGWLLSQLLWALWQRI